MTIHMLPSNSWRMTEEYVRRFMDVNIQSRLRLPNQMVIYIKVIMIQYNLINFCFYLTSHTTTGTYGIRVKNCFAFNRKNASIALIDDRGCPVNSHIITKFKTNSDGTQATATLKSMFKFPEGSEVHIQCDIVQCNGLCSDIDDSVCAGDASAFTKGGRALGQSDDGMLLAATTVFVLDPADAPCKSYNQFRGESM